MLVDKEGDDISKSSNFERHRLLIQEKAQHFKDNELLVHIKYFIVNEHEPRKWKNGLIRDIGSNFLIVYDPKINREEIVFFLEVQEMVQYTDAKKEGDGK